MKGRPVEKLVYESMFPKPKSSDPQSFHVLLARYLIFEVRQEVHAFYGHLDTQEAKYPGLDYCNPTHRIRLSRWTWHRRLFRAFDNLGLTPGEIASLTKWEGTKWAKERFERDHGVTIRDTTTDGIPEWVEPDERESAANSPQSDRASAGTVEVAVDDDIMGDDESEEELQSIGVELNQRLRERVAAHNAGDTSQPLDEDWEQWLKNALENGDLPLSAINLERVSMLHTELLSNSFFGPRILQAARTGNWDGIPDYLRTMLGTLPTSDDELPRSLEDSNRQTPSRTNGSDSSADQPAAQWRRSFSVLRLPASETERAPSGVQVQRAAPTSGA